MLNFTSEQNQRAASRSEHHMSGTPRQGLEFFDVDPSGGPRFLHHSGRAARRAGTS